MTPERLREIAVEIERYNHIRASKELLVLAKALEIGGEIDALWALADECRNWSVATPRWVDRFHHRHAVATRNQFTRLADRLDAIAHTLAEKQE